MQTAGCLNRLFALLLAQGWKSVGGVQSQERGGSFGEATTRRVGNALTTSGQPMLGFPSPISRTGRVLSGRFP